MRAVLPALLLAAALAVAPPTARAQAGSAPAKPPIADARGAPGWDQLTNQQRADLARFQDRWNDMPAVRRLQLLERERRWQTLPPERRQALREGMQNFQRLSPAQREKMRASMRALRQLPPGQQKALREAWRALTPEQRRAWLDRGGPGLSPPPVAESD